MSLAHHSHIDPPPPWPGTDAADDDDTDEDEEDDTVMLATFRDRTPHHLRAPIAHLAHAIRPYLSDPRPDGRCATRLALEVSRNVAACSELGEDFDPAATLEEMLLHRCRHGWLAVGDLRVAVGLGAAAWRRAFEAGVAAAGERRAA